MFRVGDYVEVSSVDDSSWDHLLGMKGVINEIKDSGTHKYRLNEYSWFRQDQLKYATDKASVSEGGSLRYNKGKPEFSHLSPDFIMEMMKTMTKSNEKYPYLNYTKKQDVKTASDSLMRHYLAFQMGQNLDDDTSCHHLAHLAVNAMIIFQNLKDYGDEVDNRYSVAKEKVQNGD